MGGRESKLVAKTKTIESGSSFFADDRATLGQRFAAELQQNKQMTASELMRSVLAPSSSAAADVLCKMVSIWTTSFRDPKAPLQGDAKVQALDFSEWVAHAGSTTEVLKCLSQAVDGDNTKAAATLFDLAICGRLVNAVFGHGDDSGNAFDSSKPLGEQLPLLNSKLLGVNAIFYKSLCVTADSSSHPAVGSGEPAHKSVIFCDTDLFRLGLTMPEASRFLLPCRVTPLYSIQQWGHSWIRFVNRIDQYPAAMLLGLKGKDDERFGAFIGGGMQETGTKYSGTSDTFLFQLRPDFEILPTSGHESNFVFLNLKTSTAPIGLGFGGTEGNFRMFLEQDLKHAEICLADRTYRAGNLIKMEDSYGDQVYRRKIEIVDIEVWGLGNDSDLRQQQYSKQRDEDLKMERRQVDRAKLGGSDFDREFLLQGVKVEVGREEAAKVAAEEHRREMKEKNEDKVDRYSQ